MAENEPIDPRDPNDPSAPLDPQTESEKELTRREQIAEWLTRAQFVTYTVLVLSLITLAFLWPRMFITVPAGHNGVHYRYFSGGTDTERIRGEGLNIIAPWNKLFIYEIRIQQQMLHFDVLSGEGLDLGVEVSVRFRPRQDMLGHLHKDIGTDYFDRLVKPEIQAHVRRTFGGRPAHEIYSSSRDVLQELARIPVLGKLEETPDGNIARPYVEIQELKLVDIELPDVVEGAIAEKYRQEQLMLEYEYKLEREEKEAERKRTEAAGIRDYNLIASRVSPDLLRWRGVDATVELARSQNSKVVVIGGGQGGLPVILNLDGAGAAPAAPGAPAAATPAQGAPAAAPAAAAPAPAAPAQNPPETPAPAAPPP
uniref:Membrane protease subunit stomatin/prohibitin-like protein n=1 Tax=Jahnella sp. MSr9139 TaxID=1434086 RepID=A0A4Y5SZE2_9BACT|nr:membrane protease subunit stomatin/prohibitin-like protein [Jahnella sp. MSr9139]